MNDQLQQALAAILNKTVAGAEAGLSFLGAEIPEVIQQLLIWKAVQSGVYSIAGLILVFATALITHANLKSTKGFNLFFDEGEIAPWIMVTGPVLAGCFFAGFTVAIKHGLVAVQIYVAPKVFLIEYAASLTK